MSLLIGLVLLAVIGTVAFVPAGPAATLAFGAVVVGVGAVLTFAFGTSNDPAPLGVVVVVVGLAIAALGLRRDAVARSGDSE